ncbi:MAG: hypothetical protein V1779_10915 [bacterium]
MGSEENIKVEWKKIDNLKEFTKIEGKGVYLFVYNEKIIYIGKTRVSYQRRIKQHKRHMLQGGFTCFCVNENIDEEIYDLMMVDNEKVKSTEDLKNHYKELSERGKVWIPSKEKTDTYWKPMFGKKSFEKNWLNYVEKIYQPNIKVYISNFDKEHCTDPDFIQLESQIQNTIRFKLDDNKVMGYYRLHSQYNWLGKQEISKDKLKEISYVFSGEYPVMFKNSKFKWLTFT